MLTDSYSSPGISTERIRIFLARGLAEVPEAERSYVPEHEEAHLELGLGAAGAGGGPHSRW